MSAATKPANGITIERYLSPNARLMPGNVIEIPGNSIILVSEDVVDKRAMTKDGITLKQLGVRYRLMSHDLKTQKASYIVPMTIIDVSRKRGKDVTGIQLPIGKLIFDHGLYLKYSPGIEELGTNDRGDIVLRERLESDPTVGPIINSVNTIITGRADRLVTRVKREENQRDLEEANGWLEAFELLTGRETLVSRFMCAGIEYTHRGNVTYLARTTHMNFFDIGDSEMMEIHGKVKAMFDGLGRNLPTVTITSLVGLPRNKMEFDHIQVELKKMVVDPQGLGLPKEFSESNFYDTKTGSIVPANFVLFAPLNALPDKINIITINTDYHGEVKSRGVLSPLMAIMSLIGVISAHCGAAILNRRGTATSFTGPTGTGKTTAGAFWAEKNERYRREELRRRYRIILKKEEKEKSDAEIGEKVKTVVEKVGVLCQEDWVEIAKEGSRAAFYPDGE
ncbi:MAG: phosphoenolpyruvate carboxykinase (ATP) [Thaumarchaeota archaeon]|nr:phosphoenolpyruvate carboxykinase (ATP) [Nitrososphaerota archaeon]